MNKNIILILAVVIIIVLGALLFLPVRREETASPAAPPPPPPATAEIPLVQEQIIELTAQGFLPSNITVAPGTTVRFINRDANPHWPASGIHPTHQICPGFDALRVLSPGESYSFTFTEAKTCPIHDHLNPSSKGSVVVQ